MLAQVSTMLSYLSCRAFGNGGLEAAAYCLAVACGVVTVGSVLVIGLGQTPDAPLPQWFVKVTDYIMCEFLCLRVVWNARMLRNLAASSITVTGL